MKKKLRILIPIILIIAGVVIWRHVKENGKDPNRILVSGNIEVTQLDMAFKIPGRLAVRTVDEALEVLTGQPASKVHASVKDRLKLLAEKHDASGKEDSE